jgi:hypothetical protein
MPNRDYFIPPRRGLGVTFFVLDLVQERNGGHEVPWDDSSGSAGPSHSLDDREEKK